jgi:predicted DNA-binding transcriptional regulator YafY
MTKSERLLFIINLFRVKKRITLDELAQECEVSKRTVYRDILSLSSLDIPIYFDNGYRLARNISLPALNFSQDEREALGFSLRYSYLGRSPFLRGVLRNIEIKILSALPDKNNPKLNSRLNCLTCEDRRLSPQEDSIVRTFFRGLFKGKNMEIRLKNRARPLKRLIPNSLHIGRKRWILVFSRSMNEKNIGISLTKISEIDIAD